MRTRIEELGTIIATLRRLAQNETLPQYGTDEIDTLLDAIKRTVERADGDELEQLGRASLQLILEVATAHLLAERATTLARLVAQGKPENGGLH